MNYQFTVTGIGFCTGGMTGHEDLIEAVITRKTPAGTKPESSVRHAVREALKYRDENAVLLLSNIAVPEDFCAAYGIAEQRTAETFGQMLTEAAGILADGRFCNVLLLAQSGEDGAAVLLSGSSGSHGSGSGRCFAHAETDLRDSGADVPAMDAMMRFITAVVEIRYAFRLTDSSPEDSGKDGTYIWHWAEKRELSREFGGITVRMSESERVPKAVFESKRYLLPVTFDTVGEAEETLRLLRKEVEQQGLYRTMQARIAALTSGKRAENTIVLLAETTDSLNAQIGELLGMSGQFLTEGFRWKSETGSRYIRRSTRTPKVVFMNPPGGMFSSMPFYRYVSKLYDFVEGALRLERDVFSGGSSNETLNQYLKEINITFVVMYLLEAIGIRPDYLSGASMGEVVFDLSNSVIGTGGADGSEDHTQTMNSLETTIRSVLDGRKEQENAYFGHEVNLTKYYLKCDAEKVKTAIAAYEDVFIIIEGSPKDVLICGEKASCEALLGELGCMAMELDDPMYIHTPVVEHEFDAIRTKLIDAGVCLDTDNLPCQLFSTYLKKPLDGSREMFAENFAAIITRPVNYTEAVKELYARDARVFIDLSTTQLCGGWAKETLAGCPDAEIVSIYEEKETADYLLELCTAMLAGNVSFDFEKMIAGLSFAQDAAAESPESVPAEPAELPQKEEVNAMTEERTTQDMLSASENEAIREQLNQYIAGQMAVNQKAYELYLDAENKLFAQLMAAYAGTKPAAGSAEKTVPEKRPYLWDREQVIEMTDRSMAAVLGEQYREVDQYPIRARMPLPPFLFVSRIVSIDAEFGKLRPSSIVAEYDLDETCVFRTGDTQISPLIGSEASHIAIFLIAYMGLDAMSKGTLSYRAIDSSQVSYSERPFRVGDTMRTVLKINRFVQNGSTILLFFTFETYNGEELIAVTEATGGFFTKAELASNKGILTPKKVLNRAEPKEFLHFSGTAKTSYEKEQVTAFFDGRYEDCFGTSGKKPSLKENYYIPDMKMIDRVTEIDYNGGMYGRGIICGEKQITPDMWPFKAHFKNDPVFPAIIMTDGVTQLGVFLFAHAGLLAQFDSANVTMINGNCVKSKFRGQARHGYSTLRYEVHVKDVVRTADSISVYFDAGIFNDGLQIIQVESYALKIFSDPN